MSRFEWDEEKNLKHGISFEEASTIFDGPVLTLEPAFPGCYRILRCNGSDYRIGYNIL